MKSLDQLGITSISVQAQAADGKQNGNLIGLTSTFTTADGSSHASADVWFQAKQQSSLSQSTSGLSHAITSFEANGSGAAASGAAAAGGASTASSTTAPGSPSALADATQALAASLKLYAGSHGLSGASVAPSSLTDAAQEQASRQHGWFGLPPR